MPDQELIDGLIATYRTLNLTLRPLPEEKLRGAQANGTSVRELVRRLRDDELRFSQALKVRIATGQAMPKIEEDETPVVGTEHENDPTSVLLAQFGTARESTLAMLRSLPDSEWDSTGGGGPSIRESIRQRIADDKRRLEQIQQALRSS
ncbi:MAG TPA: hypothetical protein VIL01_13370 [Thermomicrobiales bacterium]